MIQWDATSALVPRHDRPDTVSEAIRDLWEKAMRTMFGLALAGAIVLGEAGAARAQGPYGYRNYRAPSVGAASPRGYAFKDESLMSINNSYLGYGNFVYVGPDPPAPGYVSGVPRSYSPAPVRRGVRWFGRRRGYRY
jgi:hypothetical protein